MNLEEICANCGARRGLHHNMHQACPKDVNAPRDHTEYRTTVFASKQLTNPSAQKIFLLKPISEKPDKAGWYGVKYTWEGKQYSGQYKFDGEEWILPNSYENAHYLSETTAVVLTPEQWEEMRDRTKELEDEIKSLRKEGVQLDEDRTYLKKENDRIKSLLLKEAKDCIKLSHELCRGELISEGRLRKEMDLYILENNL